MATFETFTDKQGQFVFVCSDCIDIGFATRNLDLMNLHLRMKHTGDKKN